MKAKIFLLIAVVVLVSCSAYKPPKEYKFSKIQVFEKSFDAVWNSIISWAGVNGINIDVIEKASGYLSTKYNLRAENSYWMDCGKEGFGEHKK